VGRRRILVEVANWRSSSPRLLAMHLFRYLHGHSQMRTLDKRKCEAMLDNWPLYQHDWIILRVCLINK
jgi:hypothetical protein